jgi:hypothetical protein
LGGAFLFDALLRVGNGKSCSNVGEAVVVLDALVESGSSSVALLGETESPAGSAVEALLLAILKSGEALSILLASLELVGALLSDAVLRSKERVSIEGDFGSDTEALVGISAFGDVDGGLAALGGEAESPAGLGGSALLLTVLKSGDTLGVLLACSPLGGAFLLNALLRVSIVESLNGDGRGHNHEGDKDGELSHWRYLISMSDISEVVILKAQFKALQVHNLAIFNLIFKRIVKALTC